ncbi:flagellar hook protein FlgE [Ectobacillus antri]|jgi:flagellar hook protein FlgE|uniref:Flagellar hook protein FlgE n=1 Tax=Ectobacillus antri TaxID=2486280 RepID=A0ABT6H2P0_9BACI|nr:flagellar hook protein FlgE [Ectobacillus antri]MDG4656202.1 flagellar hook protein FlgE [Ectobacillus antri]MDG5752877.1 flagellar hook protein FlgE [Ectobacillus antri]
MIQSLYTSISGMKTYQEALSVTSNNIANSQTVGYKRQKAIFDDLLYRTTSGSKGDDKYAGTNAKSIGSGVKLSGVNTDYTSGVLTLTGGKTDVAFEGAGFFLLGDTNGANNTYTRKGTFSISADNRLVNAEGKYVLGYGTVAGTNNIDFSKSPQPISIPLGTAVAGQETNFGKISGNLAKDEPTTKIQFPVYDVAGNKQMLDVTFTENPDGSVSFSATIDGSATQIITGTPDGLGGYVESTQPTGTIIFDAQGNSSNDEERRYVEIGGKRIELNLTDITRYPTDKTLKVTDVTGRAASIPTDFAITDGGYVMVKYSDGSVKTAGQLAVATFPNEKGLEKIGNGNYVEGPSAGNVSIGVSGQNGAGIVRGGATEGSNVDLSTEFVDLMVYQRGFQGNSKVIKVSDEVLNDIVNLIR